MTPRPTAPHRGLASSSHSKIAALPNVRRLTIGLGFIAGSLATVGGAEIANAGRGVGEVCGELRTCDSHLSCKRTPIRQRCVPTPNSYAAGTRSRGKECYDSSDCEEGLGCTGGNTDQMHKRRCEVEERIVVSDLHQGDVIPCSCSVSAATGGRVVRPGDMFNALTNDQKLVAPFQISDPEFPECACAIVEDLRGPWVAEDRGYETWCVGMCGEQCGPQRLGLIMSHVRYGGLIIHDVCQSFINSRESMNPFEGDMGLFNDCGREGLRGRPDKRHSDANQFHSCSRPGPEPEPEDLWLTPLSGTAELTELLVAESIDLRVLVGDFDGDGIVDRFDYKPGIEPETLMLSSDGSEHPFDVDGDYEPLIADFTGDGYADIFWYRPGKGSDFLWRSLGDGSFSPLSRTVDGLYTPIVGHFNDDPIADIFWYRPGSGRDYLWLFRDNGGRVSSRLDMHAFHVPMTGDFDGNGLTDIFWHGADSSGTDHLWMATGDGEFDRISLTPHDGDNVPYVTDWDDDGWADIVFDEEEPSVWRSTGNGEFVSSSEPRYDDLMAVHE